MNLWDSQQPSGIGAGHLGSALNLSPGAMQRMVAPSRRGQAHLDEPAIIRTKHSVCHIWPGQSSPRRAVDAPWSEPEWSTTAKSRTTFARSPGSGEAGRGRRKPEIQRALSMVARNCSVLKSAVTRASPIARINTSRKVPSSTFLSTAMSSIQRAVGMDAGGSTGSPKP